MAQHKTKVVAFRITQEQFDELDWFAEIEGMFVGQFVRHLVLKTYEAEMFEARQALNKERKKAVAKAKRDAKKEAANGLS